ncbi:hypothetical protein V6N13_026965 [Hibiscus sabdariffa]|uniref:Uncharacterized protein n=1 Tax=Hibiscus sabdariffa TaxID=183260 RepID=A0ABR2N9L6_9ROSI
MQTLKMSSLVPGFRADMVKTNMALHMLDCLQKLKIINPVAFPSIPKTLPSSLIKVRIAFYPPKHKLSSV